MQNRLTSFQDLKAATSTAYVMVTRLGMSDVLGNMDFASHYDQLSSETKLKIEKEVTRFVEEGTARATAILKDKRKELDILAKALVEYETLNLEEIKKVLKGEKLDKMTSMLQTPMKLPEIVLPPGMGGESSSAAKEASPGTTTTTTTTKGSGPGDGIGGARL